LNGAPHAITVGCYSADLSPSPIKTRVKATSRRGTAGKKNRGLQEEKQGGNTKKPGDQRKNW